MKYIIETLIDVKRTFLRPKMPKRQLKQRYGMQPDIHYFEGDMTSIRTYFDYRYENQLDDFLLDDNTWNDLSGDDIFKIINHGSSTSGEQYLYYLLRSPAISQDEYDKRAKLIEVMENNPDLRFKLHVLFAKLGRRRAANTRDAFHPQPHGSGRLLFNILLVLAFIGSAISFLFTTDFFWVFFVLLIFKSVYRELIKSRIERDLATVHYSVAMVQTAKKIRKLPFPESEQYLKPLFEALLRLKPILRVGYVPTKSNLGEASEFLNMVLMLDLITYELLKNRLGKHYKDIFIIHEYLGRLDSAIAISSYRKCIQSTSSPRVDFATTSIGFNGIGLVHPLVNDAVPNDLQTTEPVLLTGSNASGKSTFLKTIAINAIFAQSICTVLGKEYSAPAFRIYTSIAIADDLRAGESYFIAEIKSLKRITVADTSKQPLLCIIDEVLRGTNTVERIATSSELLRHLANEKTLCLAATHDIELCAMLQGQYRLMHFEETVTDDGEVLFDYTIKDGPATTRNAIKLLASMGFDEEIVKRSKEKANGYSAEGRWV